MKTIKSYLFSIVLFALFAFTSCQDEITDIELPNDQETLVPNSALVNLMSSTATLDGSTDDFLDNASCFSVDLPVTVLVSDITIVIETEEDLQELEALLNNVSVDEDALDFIFPITIIFNDYNQVVIANSEALHTFIEECASNGSDTDNISCADFVYPISFSVFNSGFNLVDTITIENDQALYVFLNTLEEDDNALIVSLNFPVSIAYTNGDVIAVNTNEELAEAIENAEQYCQDDNDNCIEDEVALNLVECPWEVYLYTNNDLENLDGPLQFTFSNDGNVLIEGVLENPYTTTWSLDLTDVGLVLHIESLYYYEAQLGNWLVVACESENISLEYIAVDGTGMFLEQNCNPDFNCSITDISDILQECPWDFSDATGNYDNYQLIFNANGELLISEGMATSAIGGAWSLSSTDQGVFITLSDLTAFQNDLGGEWLIVECDDDRLELVKGNQSLVLEQDCENDDDLVFNCFGVFELVACIGPNLEAEFNLSADTIGLIDCQYSFTPSFHVTQLDAEANTNAIVDTESYWAATSEIYLRIEAESGNFEIYSIFLNTTECNYFECFESFDAILETCYTDAAVLYEFNLPLAFSNCIPTADEVTYHITQSDADAAMNAIINPENYQTAELNSFIYTRVEINGEVEIFLIQLLVNNCSAGNCTEGDVDGILTECLWHITSYNGSDNLSDYNFNFEDTTGGVVIYNDTITIDANWSTSQPNDLVVIEFSNVAGPNIQAINGSWYVVECTAAQLVLHNINDSNNEIVLDRTCE
ncbi:hypothetical protein HNV08_13585 [Winogradskyella eckloniae]|uniref:hypothetical protein n=1 Tax=Winogradskyella eckloniae TaxID=1089306 RepID=UPI0015669DA2|nr:hypothetical protein [Winogradskyella eckloniae]NRD21084.1 hypothetical protein [Winogradskyella eckloniae]